MSEKSVHGQKPNPKDYDRARALLLTVSDRLSTLGMPPKDLLDIYDFMRLTTTPSAKKRLAAYRYAGRADSAAPNSAVDAGTPDAQGEAVEAASQTKRDEEAA